MGTLGCVNDMLQRDKQNRELRKVGRNRMKDTYNRLLQLGHKTETPAISPEKMSEIRKGINQKEEADTRYRLNAMLWLLTGLLTAFLMGWLVVCLFF